VTAGVDAALAVLAERSDGHLPLPVRRRVRARWGFEDEGLSRRVALARRTAEHVLPRFENARPGDERPREMLALADAVVRGQTDSEEAIIDAVDVANELYEMLDVEIDEPALNAAMAAVRVAMLAAVGEPQEALDDPDDDEDVDADSWETAFYASMVDAPSLPSIGVAEHVEPRRAFWRWYLSEAVPATDREP
jgi:hypothetical protein